MYFDALTIAALADELKEKVLGGRVQKVLLPDELSVGLEIYAHQKRRYLLASAHPRYARLYLASEKLRRGMEKPTPLLLLLRKYVRGGRVASIKQPPWERILRIGFEHPRGDTILVVEVMGRYSNVVLVSAEGLTLESIKHVGPDMSRYRAILPQRFYVPPPPPEKLDPTDVTELRLRKLLAAFPEEPIWRRLVQGIFGVSPLLAKEVTYRATGDAEAFASQVTKISPLLDAFQEMLMMAWGRYWQPTLVREGDRIVAFAPYPPTQYGHWEEVESISGAVEAYFQQAVGRDAYAAAKRGVWKAIVEARKRLERKREALQRSLISREEAEELRCKGELILAYAQRIEPGQRSLEASFKPGEPPLTIELDPSLSPVENAKAYFKRYKKAKSAAREIPIELRKVSLELAYLDQLEADLELAGNWPEIEEVKGSLIEAGYLKREEQRPKAKRSRPLSMRSPDGFTILVGRNSRQNEEVTFDRAAPDDLWLHVKGVPGSHVVVKAAGQEVPQATLRRAAELAAYYSKAQ
ncbi:MAG: NFACT RNA binding domain-containing protein, partial [Chloroflexota bacterium]|nr:NFACT RNA binding domain-containing protein [Chloroflexota bacterium]